MARKQHHTDINAVPRVTAEGDATAQVEYGVGVHLLRNAEESYGHAYEQDKNTIIVGVLQKRRLREKLTHICAWNQVFSLRSDVWSPAQVEHGVRVGVHLSRNAKESYDHAYEQDKHTPLPAYGMGTQHKKEYFTCGKLTQTYA